MNTIDLICLLPLAFAIIAGFRKGLVIEIATLVAFILAILACLKLTHWVIGTLRPYIGDTKWLPFVSYLLVFVLVYILVLWVGMLLEKVVKIVQLGLFNRVLGMLFSLVKMCFIISLIFWLCDKAHLIPASTSEGSFTYKALHHFAQDTVEFISKGLPFLKGVMG